MKRFSAARHIRSEQRGIGAMTGYDDRRLESFLLNELVSSEREEIEQRIFADDDLFARVEEIETDLIDGYAGGTLEPDMMRRFEASLESVPARREKLLVARVLHSKLATSRTEAAEVVPFSKRNVWMFRGALAAGIIGVIVGMPMLLQRSDDDAPNRIGSSVATATPGTEAPTHPVNLPAEGEVTITDSAAATESFFIPVDPTVAIKRPPVPAIAGDQASSPAASVPRSMTFVLATFSLRSGTELDTLEVERGIDSVNVRLILESEEYSSYNVAIKDSRGRSVWQGTRLPLTTIDSGPAVSFDVPASAFEDGRHELVLAGIDETHTEEVAYVDFDVVRAER